MDHWRADTEPARVHQKVVRPMVCAAGSASSRRRTGRTPAARRPPSETASRKIGEGRRLGRPRTRRGRRRAQPDAEVDEGQVPTTPGDPAEGVDEPEPSRDDGGQTAEEHDADGGSVEVQDLVDRLAGQHAAGGDEAEVHHDDEQQRDHRAVHPELRPAEIIWGRPSRGPCAECSAITVPPRMLPISSPIDRPEGVRAEDDGQRAVDDGGDLEVGAEPEGELADAACRVVRRRGRRRSKRRSMASGASDVWWSVMVSV